MGPVSASLSGQRSALSFLDLPAEVRRMIYRYLFEDMALIVRNSTTSSDITFSRKAFHFELVATCRTVRAEAMPLLNQATTFQCRLAPSSLPRSDDRLAGAVEPVLSSSEINPTLAAYLKNVERIQICLPMQGQLPDLRRFVSLFKCTRPGGRLEFVDPDPICGLIPGPPQIDPGRKAMTPYEAGVAYQETRTFLWSHERLCTFIYSITNSSWWVSYVSRYHRPPFRFYYRFKRAGKLYGYPANQLCYWIKEYDFHKKRFEFEQYGTAFTVPGSLDLCLNRVEDWARRDYDW